MNTISFNAKTKLPQQKDWIIIYSLDGIRKWKKMVGYNRADVKKRFFDLVNGRHNVIILDVDLAFC